MFLQEMPKSDHNKSQILLYFKWQADVQALL